MIVAAMQGEFEKSGHADWLLGEIRRELQVDVSRDFAALQRVQEAAKKAGEEFQSGAEAATINLPFITATASGPKHFNRSVSLREWNAIKGAASQPVPDSHERLTAPPRDVPTSLAIVNLLNWTTLIGWLVLGFGSIFVAGADYSFITFRGPHRTAAGQVTAIEETQASEAGEDGGTSIYANHYSFSVAGHHYSGVSYSTGARVGRGDKVTIEFDENDPSRSRISGMRRVIRNWSPWLLAIPIIGLSMIVGGLGIGRRRNDLLRDGFLAPGKLTATRETDPNLENSDYELTFEFTARDGRRAEAKIRTNDVFLIARMQKERLVPLLCDPDHPPRVYALEAEPARPRIDEHGDLRGRQLAAVARLVQVVLVLSAALAFYLSWIR